MDELTEQDRVARLGAFRSPNFTWYWISQVTTNVGTWMQMVATGWLVLQLTNSPALLGFNAVVQAVPILAFALVGGIIADRVDRYRLTVASYVVQIIPDALLAWLVMTGRIEVWHVFTYSVVSATISAFATPGRQAFIPSLVPKRDLLSAMALNSVTWQGAAVVGPALAGVILAIWGLPGSFNINVASDFVSLAAILAVRLPPMPPRVSQASGWSDIREGMAFAWRDQHVRTLLISVAVVTFLARPYANFMPVFARDVFDVGPEGLGVMLTLPAVGTIVSGALLAVAGRIPLVRTFIATALGLAVALIAFCVTRNFPAALALLFVVGACQSSSTTIINTVLQEVIDERIRGRVMSLFMLCTWGSWRVGSLPMGIAADLWGAPLAVGVSAAALLALLVPMSRSRGLRGPVEQVVATPSRAPRELAAPG
ncbi:MAG TPA: MFS transporter [Chloroflexota bacterium]|nr:MFS transporter [Chloroflexota bacterium]